MLRRPPLRPVLSALLLAAVAPSVLAAEPLRLKHLYRCEDMLDRQRQTFCLDTRGMASGDLQVLLDGKPLPANAVDRRDGLRISLDNDRYRSGPLWLQQGDAVSNPVWLSMAGSHVLAAKPGEVARNMDGLNTYIDLVSVVIEEDAQGLDTAKALAKKYGAEVVGAIPPLNTFQLRLPAKDLIQRDALVLRLGSELSVDAVVIEESSAEEQEAPAGESADDHLDEEEWTANRFLDAVNYYQRRIPSKRSPIETKPVRIGLIERDVDFDAPDFKDYLGAAERKDNTPHTRLYSRDADKPDGHGTTVAGILAARWDEGGNTGFLRGLDGAGPGFEVIVDRNSDAGITANIAASVNLVEDGVRVLNWSWGIHRVGARNIHGDEIDSLVRSGVAMSGYEELLEEFFLWLRREHPDVVVVNSAGNGASYSGADDYRLPSSFITEQLFVVGGHQRSDHQDVAVSDPAYVTPRSSSNVDTRVDITAAACVRASTADENRQGSVHCGTSYATPLVAGVVAALMSINPELHPDQLRMLLRRSAMTIGEEFDFEPADADDLTAPILPSERDFNMNDKDIGRSARLDIQKALDLTVRSLDRAR
ncbi:peptidase S8 and S53 subtilisin kexin sedolisin [Pseudomonas daroniae]|uniref:Peptidase S8 and S53 subtilisin kexin sedolisin n=1 Tax=Phytopseudomonas daroniae TaxID=2487519 RepID=A0A4V2KB81_9GAMM|nr:MULTISPECIES: S8/S53 family peptidase [Pseudomonas]TBU83298.1 peptidase S8 and S53 subtilisin kexin sedolisin [Pseudomonas daroniae]TBU84937.1 peptidase S8 and S53 subtilisin kexin sedolisin [Pseudomonas sp. FRB 228]TBU93770.1 peptidase S8 and S53 subtilisin kexin sedolisin [Pseudomonas daroniae]